MSKTAAPYLFIAPALLILGGFGLTPVLFAIVMSFMDWNGVGMLGEMSFAGLDNYAWVLADDNWFGSALINSLWLSATVTLLVHATAIPLAFFIDQRVRRFQRGVVLLYLTPFLVAGVVVGLLSRMLFDSGPGGIVNWVLNSLGNWQIAGLQPLAWLFPTQPTEWWRYGATLTVGWVWWGLLGWNVMLYVAALQFIARHQYEAARLDGANGWQQLWWITLPQIRPMMFFAMSLSVVWGVQVGGGRRSLVSSYIYDMAFGSAADFGAASAMSSMLIPILAFMLWFLWRYVGGRPDTMGHVVQRAPSRLGRMWREAWSRTHARVWGWLRSPAGADQDHAADSLRGFDGMRAIACLAVIAHHFAQRLDGEHALYWFLEPVRLFAMKGELGVSLFFVLSGALLSLPFWKRFLDGAAPPSLGDYALRRAARIAPGYWTALTVCVLLGLVVMPDALYVWERFAAGFTFVSGLHYVSFFPSQLDPVLWSISFEVLCYAMLPLLLLPAWRVVGDRDPRRALRYLVFVLIGLQIAHFLITLFFMTGEDGKGWQHGQIGGAKQWLPYWSPASFMTQFMLGSVAALGIAWRAKAFGGRRDEAFDRQAVRALIAIVVTAALFSNPGVPSPFTRQPYVAPLFAGLCAWALFAMHHGLKVHAALDNRIFRFVATISFALYLWHWPVMELTRLFIDPDFQYAGIRDVWHWALLCAGVAVVSFALACLSWYGIERPVLRAARGWRGTRRGAPASSAPA